ncbi:LPXTG cell wall anchor domain-containing protein [Enterococcus faecalis]|nr:LPXTG cell wall anchor domain-containing protein [Enterococcus faecalis]EIW2104752.1 LPXTG cell wall anchor domain-containing protein [Enterococcus faecalis]
MHRNKKFYFFFGLFTLTLCLLFSPSVNYANTIDSGQTDVGISFSKSPIKPEDPNEGLDKIPSGPSPTTPSRPSDSGKSFPKTGEIASVLLTTLGMGILLLLLLFKGMNKKIIVPHVMEDTV